MSLTLHHGWRSSASRRVRLVLAEKGLAYDSRLIDMVRGDQHSPEYLAINPNGVVPTLVHDGRVVYESAVIAEYLDECFPEPPLMPEAPHDRAVLRCLLRWIDERCLPHLIVFNWSAAMQPVASRWTDAQLAERLARIPGADRREAWTRVARKPYTDDEKAAAMAGLLALLDRLDALLAESRGPWLLGARFTLADIGALPFAMRISELNPAALQARPAVHAWWQAARVRPSFTAARIEPFTPSPETLPA